MRISDWSSDVCSSDLHLAARTMPDIAAAIMAGTSAVGLATPRGTVAGDDGIFSGEFHLIEANEADFIVLLTSDAIALFRRDEFMGQSERLSMDSHMRLMRAALESGDRKSTRLNSSH